MEIDEKVIQNMIDNRDGWIKVVSDKDDQIKALNKKIERMTPAVNILIELSESVYGSPTYLNILTRAGRIGDSYRTKSY